MCGGANGERGLNYLTRRSSGRVVNIGGKNTVKVDTGDLLSIYTPGGGGFGIKSDSKTSQAHISPSKTVAVLTGGSLLQYTSMQESA